MAQSAPAFAISLSIGVHYTGPLLCAVLLSRILQTDIDMMLWISWRFPSGNNYGLGTVGSRVQTSGLGLHCVAVSDLPADGVHAGNLEHKIFNKRFENDLLHINLLTTSHGHSCRFLVFFNNAAFSKARTARRYYRLNGLVRLWDWFMFRGNLRR